MIFLIWSDYEINKSLTYLNQDVIINFNYINIKKFFNTVFDAV